MSKDLTAAFTTELDSPDVTIFAAIEAVFPSGTVNIWTGVGALSWDSKTWDGVGALLSLEPIIETTDSRANRIGATLSGLEADFFDPVMAEDYQNGAASMWLGFMASDGSVVSDPYLLFSGTMDNDRLVDENDSSSLTIWANSRLDDMLRSRTYRYTNTDQQALHTGDIGLEFVSQLQDLQINWGKPANARGGNTGGVNPFRPR